LSPRPEDRSTHGSSPRGSRRSDLSLPRVVWILAAACVGLALSLSPVTEATSTAALTLDVTFTADGAITVALPDGTPVGTSSGSPTVIPAGYYTLQLIGPGGCTELPYFELKGPGETIQNDMDLGELKLSLVAYFQPNSTYTWLDDADPDVIYTFETSGQIIGTAPSPTPSPTPKPTPGTGGTESSQDPVGALASRGSMAAVVTATGKATLSYRGAKAKHLTEGRYTITVTDKSTRIGFALRQVGHKTVTVTGAAFTGRRSRSIKLTPGTWSVLGRSNQPIYSFIVHSGS
jgi:hypothetical protein